MKRLSVIIPMYNSAQWLPKCLDSVLAQDVAADELEVICIDDGSPDESAEVARHYQLRYPDTIVVLSQPNQGPSAARNMGIRYATGQYLCFVDPDDYVQANVYQTLIERMDQQQLDMLRFNFQAVDESYHPITVSKHPVPFDYSEGVMDGTTFLTERLGTICYIWPYIYRTAFLKENDLYCTVGQYFDDTDWMPKVLLLSERIACMPVVGYYYLIRRGSLVQAQGKDAALRKLKGGMSLIDTLLADKEMTADKRVKQWYRQMISFTVFSMMTTIALYDYDHRSYYLKQWKQKQVRRILYSRTDHWQLRLKKWLANGCPRTYLFLLRAANSRR